MTTYVLRDGELVEKPERVIVPRLQVIRDWGPVQSPIDGRVYEGRTSYGGHLKAHGCEILGNDVRPEQMGGPGGYTGGD